MKEKIFSEAHRCRKWAIEKSGWKWLEKYRLNFLKTAPVIVAVVGDPKKTGLDIFQEEGGVGYQHACAAAIQNMHLRPTLLALAPSGLLCLTKSPCERSSVLLQKKRL